MYKRQLLATEEFLLLHDTGLANETTTSSGESGCAQNIMTCCTEFPERMLLLYGLVLGVGFRGSKVILNMLTVLRCPLTLTLHPFTPFAEHF